MMDKPRVETTWQIDDGERGGETFYRSLYLTDAAVEHALKSLANAGFKGDDITAVDQIVGNKALLVLDEDTWEGKTRTVIKWINKLGGGTPMTGANRESFAQKMKARLALQGVAVEDDDTPNF